MSTYFAIANLLQSRYGRISMFPAYSVEAQRKETRAKSSQGA